MMRVALVAPPYESVPPRKYGGTERVVDLLARGLSERGLDVTVFATGDSRTAGRLRSTVKEALRPRLDHLPLGTGIYHLLTLTELIRSAGDFDLIHNHDDFWMMPVLTAGSPPLLTTLHGRLDLPELSETYQRFASPRHGLISISLSQRRPQPHLNWVANIPHGLPLANVRPRLSAEPSRGGEYLAFLGRFCTDKGPLEAIRIAHDSGMPLKIAAKIEGRVMQEYFDTLIRPHLDGRNIEYVGEITDSEKDEFLGNAAALAFPIDWPEPFGLVMIEALARGTPVLARPRGSVPEILEHGVTGYIEEDVASLTRRVKDLPALSRTVCRARAEARFSLERMIEDHLHAYRTALEPRSRNSREGTDCLRRTAS